VLFRSDLRPSLTEEQAAKIATLGQEDVLSKGAILYRQGDKADHIFLLVAGRVKASSLNEHGDETVLRVHFPGSLLGLTAIGIDPLRDATATALDESRLAFITRDQILRLMHDDGALGVHISQLLQERLASFQFLVHEVLSNTVEQRVVRALLGFSMPQGAVDGASRRELQLSHKELSHIVAARRPTVSLALQSLSEAGLISLERRQIMILNPEGLSRFLTD